MKNYDIYALGAALLDTEIEVSDADLNKFNIEKGVMTLVDEARQHELVSQLSEHLVHSKRSSGGSAANSVIAASYLGSKCFYSCKVADDSNGRHYLSDLSAAGVDYQQNNASEQGITGKCLVLITPDAERTMNTFLGISESLSTDEIDEQALAASTWVYLEGYQVTSASGRPAAIKLRELAEKNGVKTALSLSDPAMVEFFHDGLCTMIGSGVDLLFCNEAEALSFTKSETLEQAAQALKEVSKSYVITLGAKGAYVFDGHEHFHIEGQAADAIDTNGAGDMFAGCFLHSLCQGKDFKEAAKLANSGAAMVVSQYGPRLKAEQYKTLLNQA
ncbi:adenosine kinase [Agaribacterium haliotis]|uniref:adenosine kinase n=1 Tax=Agaribacterium haliotis TaxID=2013869 RepID=UPI000BB536A6|nr:adenosine kinase [Agaribacterium haliotis]